MFFEQSRQQDTVDKGTYLYVVFTIRNSVTYFINGVINFTYSSMHICTHICILTVMYEFTLI